MIELGFALLLVALFFAALIAVRVAEHNREAANRRHVRLRFPHDLSGDAVAAFLQGLAGLLPPGRHGLLGWRTVVFEIEADDAGINHRLSLPAQEADFILGQVRAAMPSVRVHEDPRPKLQLISAVELKLVRGRVPLRTEQKDAVAASLLAALHPLRTGERIVLQWVVAPSTIRAHSEGSPAADDLHDVLTGRQAVSRLRREERTKLREPLFNCVGRIAVGASDRRSASEVVRRVLLAVYATRGLEAQLITRWLPSSVVIRRVARAAVPPVGFPSVLNSTELGAVVGFPIGSPVLPGLTLGGARELPPSPAASSEGLVVGVSTYAGAEREVAIEEREFSRHLLIAGPTGAGKSALLNHLVVNRIHHGDGVLLIDPAGDLAARVIDSVPQSREAEVIVIDPADIEFPVGINLLGVPNRSNDLIVDDFVAVVKRAWGEHLVGARSEDILRMACTTITARPDAVLTDLPRLLVDKSFRRKLLADIDDPIALGPFWAWFDALTIAKRADVVGPISNKLRSFYRPLLRNIIGQAESSFSMAEAMQSGKIIICSLARGAMGEGAASFFGAMLMALWAQAVQSRVSIEPEQRRPFYAFVDEFQTLLGFSSPVDEILAQARKFSCGLAIATQSLSVLPTDLKQSALVNTRSKVVFQTGAADAPLFAKEFAPHLTADDLRGLEGFHGYAAVSTGNMTSPPISIRTLPPPATTGSAERVLDQSRKRYGRPRAEVEKAIRGRYEEKAPTAPVGRKPRAKDAK